MSFVVAIDGPAGTGKGTVTKIIAEKMGLLNIDTGAMYRCITLACIDSNISFEDVDEIKKVLDNTYIDLIFDKGVQKVFLNNVDVSDRIRMPEVDGLVAKFAAIKCVRDKLTNLQRKMGQENDVIMEGRDIGTVVFPNADVKIFLDCSLEERARRRYKQNLEKGINESYDKVLESIINRHKLETERDIAPFVKADDAILIDSTNMSIEEVVDEIEKIIKEYRNG